MPRTKQVRKKSSMMKIQKKSTAMSRSEVSSSSSSMENDELIALTTREYESVEEFKEEYNKYYNKKVEETRLQYENSCEEIKKMMKRLRDNLPQAFLNKKLSEVVSEDCPDQNKEPNARESIRLPRSRTPVESFEFKRPKTPSVTNSRSSSRKRSVSASAIPSSRTNEGFKTPMLSNRRLMHNSVITPKVYCESPMSVMRRPQHGELAVSMSGSPLMVSAVASEDIPTVNVPLQDGRVFSIMPEPGAPPPDLPEFDETTKQYLKTLRAHLEILAPNTP